MGGDKIRKLRVNHEIYAKEVRIVGDGGKQMGVMPVYEAIRLAREQGLALVEIAPEARPPVCKIMDYGKYRYQQTKREKEVRKHQRTVEIKEIKMRPKIDKHDYETKLRHTQEFLKGGHRVKVSMMFRGREMAHLSIGSKLLEKMLSDLGDSCTIEQHTRMDGKTMNLLLSPKSVVSPKKTEGGGRENA